MSDLTIVVPTFNEADNVAALVRELDEQLVGIDAEILFVDDSTDQTPEIIRLTAMGARLPVRVLHREQPEGRLAGAVIAGLRATTSAWIAVMDGDLQHPATTVPVLYNRALSGPFDLVVASRYIDGGSASGLSGCLRRTVSSWTGRLAKSIFPLRLADCSDPMSGFFVARRDAIELDDVTQCGYKILLALLVHRQLSVAEVPFQFAERHAGESKASFREGMRFLQLLILLRTGPSFPFLVRYTLARRVVSRRTVTLSPELAVEPVILSEAS